jgi:hypothetical protein
MLGIEPVFFGGCNATHDSKLGIGRWQGIVIRFEVSDIAESSWVGKKQITGVQAQAVVMVLGTDDSRLN